MRIVTRARLRSADSLAGRMAITWPTSSRGWETAREPSAPHADGAGLATSARDDEPTPDASAGAPRIWAVGGGKGGVGKSLVASSLAAAIAGTGRRCAIIDADLGAANLHTLLGASRPRLTLSHFLTGEVSRLSDVMVQTSVPNLWLVSGNQALLEMANPKRSHKKQLVRHIRGLDVDEVLLDLGAGSAFTVLDFFLLAHRGVVVVTPEPTAIENAEDFLRAAFYRSLRDVARRPDVRAAIECLREKHHKERVRSARELIALVREIDPTAAKPLEERAQAFAPMLIVNQVQNVEHRRVGPDLVASCRERLGVRIELAGSIESDPNVRAAVAQRQPAVQAFPLSRFSKQIEALAQRLLRQGSDPPGERAADESGDEVHPPLRLAPLGARAAERASAPVARLERARPPAALRSALPPVDLAEPGAYLRRCREKLCLTLAEMTERTRIRGLDHIENERFERLPADLYLKSYVTAYARELGVSEADDLAASYVRKCRAAREAR